MRLNFLPAKRDPPAVLAAVAIYKQHADGLTISQSQTIDIVVLVSLHFLLHYYYDIITIHDRHKHALASSPSAFLWHSGSSNVTIYPLLSVINTSFPFV